MNTIWRSIGDVFTNFILHNNRMMPEKVCSSTTLYWLINDESKNLTDTEAFLDCRLGNVASFGKIKRQIQNYFRSLF